MSSGRERREILALLAGVVAWSPPAEAWAQSKKTPGRDVFDEAFPRNEKHKVRNFASMALEARNATSHLSIPLQDEEALRYLDAVHCLLKAVKAPAADIAEAKRLYDAQRQSGGSAATAQPAAQPAPAPKLDLASSDAPAKALKPWIEVALPH